MDSDERRKLCWECGGEVPAEAEQCPFCGAAFETVADESASSSFFTTSDENDESGSSDSFTETGAPRPLYQPIDKYASLHSEHSSLDNDQEEPETEEDSGARQQLICLCFLIPGFALLLFGIIMFFFSQEGYLTLKWDASWGMFVFALAGLFIYFGARAYKKL